MTDATDIRSALIDRLAPIFGSPRSPDHLAGELIRHLPDHATRSMLEELADRIIQTRKAKGFPSASDLISLVGSLRPPNDKARTSISDRLRDRDEAEKRARSFLRGTEIAGRAVSDRWGPALLDFAAVHGREPDPHEERDLVALSRRSDAIARESGMETVTRLRETMHDRAAYDLTGPRRNPNATSTQP